MSVYAVDLPGGFYGLSSALLVGEFSGAATFDNVQFNGVSAVPEPSTYAAILGAMALGFVAIRRRRNAAVTG
ncbi:MAG: PEP-CTERM sorting domain-containing protein [Cephaloticoccus sp.]|nr:PEP-CTERM sorting domain-containing protein [Cephaloticoccus sp.]MCF7760367.1 PEP-CTERM sorting domain-containing protein [Cephaloticoccus sp.]